jgi:hypothetical protein
MKEYKPTNRTKQEGPNKQVLKQHSQPDEENRSSVRSIKVISDIEDIVEKAQEHTGKKNKPTRRNAMVISGSRTSNEYYVLRQSLALRHAAFKSHVNNEDNKSKLRELSSKVSSHLEQQIQMLSVKTLKDKISSTFPLNREKMEDDDEELRRYASSLFKTSVEEIDRSNLKRS